MFAVLRFVARFAGNHGFCTLVEGEGRRLRARAIVIGRSNYGTRHTDLFYLRDALGTASTCARLLARLFACLPLFVLLVDPHAYETTLVNNSARVTLSDERA